MNMIKGLRANRKRAGQTSINNEVLDKEFQEEENEEISENEEEEKEKGENKLTEWEIHYLLANI